jgi:hypothetical protein
MGASSRFIDPINFADGTQRRGGWRVNHMMPAEDPMKPIVFAALALMLAGSPALAQTGGPYRGNPAELGNMPQWGPLVSPGGAATSGANSRDQAASPIPATREEWQGKPADTQPPIQDVRPVPGKPLPPAQNINKSIR